MDAFSDKKEREIVKEHNYYSIINDLSLVDKDFRKYLRMNATAAIPIYTLILFK